MEISYLSTSRLPTQKAYGVTVIESWRAAQRSGINLKIYSPGPTEIQAFEKIVHLPSIEIPLPLRKLKIPRTRKVIFGINSILIPLFALTNKEFQQTKNIWLRDPLSALVLTYLQPEKKILLEIHHKPVGFGRLILKRLQSQENVKFSAISPRLILQLLADYPSLNIFESPMAVPTSFFRSQKITSLGIPLKLLYVGKGQSSGFDNGLAQLVLDFARVVKSKPSVSLTFLGLEPEFKNLVRELQNDLQIPLESIILLDHVPHNEVIEVVANHDVGILPYPQSTYNDERFPIKTLEYAAAGKIILASNIESHTEIIGLDNAYFYTPGRAGSFENVISEIVTNQEASDRKILSALSWAKGFTYEKRIQRVVSNWLGTNF